MAVQPQTPYKEYTANGSTKSFSLGFDCESQDHLIVLVDNAAPSVGAWSLSGGSVVFGTAPGNGKKITIQRNTPFRRDEDFQSYDNSFRPPGVNNGFDKIWLKLQELGVADWILSNRINDLRAYVDQQDSELQQNIDNLKIYVDDKDDELRAYLMEEIRKQGVALDQLDEYYNYLMQRLAQIAVDKGWAASFVVDASGLTQQQVNGGLESVSDLSLIPSPKNHSRVYVKSYHSGAGVGGGEFIYDAASTEAANDVTIFGSGEGRWKRPADEIITPYHAGAVDGTDASDALDAFATFVFNDDVKTQIRFCGDFKISRPLNFNYRNRGTLDFNLKLTALNSMRYVIALRGAASCTGTISVEGTGVANNWASMGVDYGVVLNGVQSGKLPSIRANKFKYFGVVMDEYGNIGMPIVAPVTYFNNTCAELTDIIARDCGCSQISPWVNNNTGYTYSNPVQSGSSGVANQRTTVNVTGIPFSSVEQSLQAYAVINNRTYKVMAADFTNNTVSLFPWLELNEPVSGSIKFFFGGAYFSHGSNGGPTKIGRIDAIRCATGVTEMALYGVNVTSITTQYCAVGAALGSSASDIGPQSSAYIGFYTEAVYRNMTLIGVGSCTVVNRLGVFAGVPFNNCEKIGPNNRVGDYGANADSAGWRNVFMPASTDNQLVGTYYKGARLNKDLQRPDVTLSVRAIAPRLYYRNGWTVNIDDPTVANTAKGLDDAIIGFIGTGANGAPTGTFTFNPPSGWTVNGSASAAFSGFGGPAIFVCYWNINDKNVSINLVSQKAVAQPDSAATDINGLKTDFNALLEKLRTAGLLSN